MNWLTLYMFAMWPVFVFAFVHYERKQHDIPLITFMIMVLISLIPFLREIILAIIAADNINETVLFKRYTAKVGLKNERTN